MIAGFSREDILNELLLAPRRALVPLPDTQVIERPGWWQVTTMSLTRGGMNEVLSSELDESTCDAVIAETIDSYVRRGLRFRWTIVEHTRPADLGERLARAGLVSSSSYGMARSTEVASKATSEGVAVEQVDLSNVDDFTKVMAEGWGVDAAPLTDLHERMLTHPERRTNMFLARSRGEPAGASAYIDVGRSAYLLGAVVLERHRGEGLYKAMVDARLRHAAARGIGLGTSIAKNDTSAPILTRLGFETVCSFTSYSNW